ncbi:M64 family metallopeptidase [Streptomyces antimycoticus]|uniref:M64 family metallopeptidase n=1 Tax=Streptomyces antimycoticus TaxID=68175 RepID=UPI002570F18B|nr:M64 family metallopeptidase [Streptomyces antimycoticus]WJD98906.1 M64 family metallopeptidase [Streptomyces antimycoticus]
MRRRIRSRIRSRISLRTAAAAGGIVLAAAAAMTGPATASPGAAGPRAAAGSSGPADAASSQRALDVEYFTGPGAHPRHTEVPAATPERLARAARSLSAKETAADGEVGSLIGNGTTADKLDVVFIGDGYTAGQQADFQADARSKWDQMSAVEPYASYKDLFNVWTVDAVSNQSGVSGDPSRDVVKDTALGSYFWCDDIERLLCVDTAKVESYAAKAPEADLVVVLGNSTKYGGAGYTLTSQVGYDGIATASSDHADSDQIAVHETGHSLGKLADEYFYPEYGTYTGAEPDEGNATKLTAGQMTAQQKKWYRWIGQTSPDGGTVGAYEGGRYYPKGINRPTDNSIMRTLGREFSLPGREAMIAGFNRHASVLSSRTATTTALKRSAGIQVSVPKSASLKWYVDGAEVTAANGKKSVTPATLGVPSDGATHTVTAKATDGTNAVKDPALRKLLTDSRTWKVTN